MRSVIIAIFALACAGAWGQTKPCPSKAWVGGKCLPFCELGQLTSCKIRTPQCGPYQHLDSTVADVCGVMEPSNRKKEPVCNTYPQSVCIDDAHVVTEKEWQELMMRLEKLEAQANGQIQCTFDSYTESAAGWYVVPSILTPSQCHAQPNKPKPGTGWVIGYLSKYTPYTTPGMVSTVELNRFTAMYGQPQFTSLH